MHTQSYSSYFCVSSTVCWSECLPYYCSTSKLSTSYTKLKHHVKIRVYLLIPTKTFTAYNNSFGLLDWNNPRLQQFTPHLCGHLFWYLQPVVVDLYQPNIKCKFYLAITSIQAFIHEPFLQYLHSLLSILLILLSYVSYPPLMFSFFTYIPRKTKVSHSYIMLDTNTPSCWLLTHYTNSSHLAKFMVMPS